MKTQNQNPTRSRKDSKEGKVIGLEKSKSICLDPEKLRSFVASRWTLVEVLS